jgi:beta-mannosidase
MIRLWGGGHYELDYYYDLCSRKGLMIWHDFMFANTLYPPTKKFQENALTETREQVKRLRNQASVVFWNGNNEI